ncbi:GNAT family N-acetyltransferase [Achromobacter sp. SD115]|uniref:GNAT family N-acetyltransferase n=1 Tax=Achromobacter sp. SD115 TaxID=2782011 RepID=UPI001A960BE6|nr:GNAT family N-acetyltransferase [Achromobacter sp. SD115]MBO1014376.1 GNAT family N-acetyltransferase [Achromobacter sp. SD115]
MTLIVRPAHAGDLSRAQELVTRSINDLAVRHGFGSIATPRPPDFQAFCLRDDPRGLWVAEDEGDIAGFALSWVCDRLWFLAELFVAPGRQGQGIGDKLLRSTLAHASQTGASEKCLITFAFNVASQGLYVRHGLLPRVPIHLCRVDRESLAPRLQDAAIHATPIARTGADFDALRKLDAAALGISREKHHRYLLDDASIRGVFLDDGRARLGYAYIGATGHIGPMAVMRRDAMPGAFRAALDIAAAGPGKQVSVFIPGASAALAIALELGMRLALPMVLMSARDYGDWTRYLPRNPGFM